ncbi:response regulator [Deferribacter autotrophicus]|uniref:histidine kinase n=1 Tax=Deferribacter autotrophicus TaxID=500465 RepID=A0A5A8F8L3_9BACT|nr:response regulator [Deferribacter autotrophicus]KAA0258961.1 response regulator [Deferribacter autotrophicus]
MDNKKLFKIFTEELTTHINNIRTFINNFFEAEEKEYLTKIVKELHTLKGSSGILGLHNLTDIFHNLENYFQRLTKHEIEDNDKIKIIEIINILEKIPKNLDNPNKIIDEIDQLLKSSVIIEKKFKDEQKTSIITTKNIATEKVASLKTEFQKLNTHIYDLLNKVRIEGFTKNKLLEQLEKIGYQLNRLNLTTFNALDEKLKNIAHLTATKLSKNVKLEIINSNVEVDEEILAIANEILTHIIRNAVYHGIENPEERIKVGKSKTGKITVQFKQASDRIHIIVTDDGKGIDVNKIIEKGIENGLIQPDDIPKLKKEDIYNLLFNENFSTTLEVDEISGRGLGLSIVREKIEKIGGFVEIESEIGKYTKFILNIPFTFKSVYCKILATADNYLAVPISIIDSIEKLITENIKDKDGTLVIEKNGTLFNLYKLSELFNIDSTNEKLLIFFKNTKSAVAVESVGENILFDLIPIKGISSNYKYFVGFSIYNNRPIAILNPSYLTKTALRESRTIIPSNLYEKKVKKTILVADDNPVITETIKELLTNEGYNILTAQNGVEAFELFRNKNIDFIITDIEMPIMDGLTLTKNIRKLNKSIPILILSSKGDEQDIQNGLDAGANGYFIKRFFIKDSFLKKIKELL